MVTITLYVRQQKRHRCIEQAFGLCGRGRGWDDLGEWHWNMYNIIYEIESPVQVRCMILDAWGLCIVNEANVDAFSEMPLFLYDPANVGNFISGSSAFSKPRLYMCSPSWTPLPSPSPSHPSGSSQCTSPEHPPCIMYRTWTGDLFHIWQYTCFNAILPNHTTLTLSHRVQRLFYTSVSLLLSHIQGYHYHLSKFHIYVLVYCIGVFLSGLHHSV